MVDLKEKKNCTGCSACADVCPQKCIEMKPDEHGFKYPFVELTNCFQCGTCERVCETAASRPKNDRIPKAFGIMARDDAIRWESSSGGVFSLLADCVLRDGGIVIGAGFSSDFSALSHGAIKDSAELSSLRGSKYLQSTLNGSLAETKRYLDSGKTVLFSGTPCQVDGLKAFLGCDYKNLLCVDLVCHGVPSPLIWKKYCTEVEEQGRGKIIAVKFRQKQFSSSLYCLGFKLDNQRVLLKSKTEDPYLRLFLKNYTLRPSCYECKHKGLSRKSDITIADFWGARVVAPELYDGKGTSLLLVHSRTGLDYLERINRSVLFKEVDVNAATDHNPSILISPQKPRDIEAFWKDANDMTIDNLAKKYCPISIKTRIQTVVAQIGFFRVVKGNTIHWDPACPKF